MRPIIKAAILGVLGLYLFSCKQHTGNYNIGIDTAMATEAIKKTKVILYQMQLPSEMAKIFEGEESAFNASYLNSVENASKYLTSSQTAMNIGVYGVDLSYCRLFDENQNTLLLVQTIRKLSEQLGIPKEEFLSTFKDFEKNIGNRDSLEAYISQFYSTADKYLKSNESEVISGLIVLGGWIEAMHIACSMIDDENINHMTERIAIQKYSLNTLISLLSSYSGDLTIAKYLLRLKVLKKYFDKVNIFYDQGDLTIDTLNKLIAANQLQLNIPKETVIEIKTIIESIRNEIIN